MKQSTAKFLRAFVFIMAIAFIVLSVPMLAIEIPMFFLCIIGSVFCFFLARYIKRKYIHY